jgi:hypothetical protein
MTKIKNDKYNKDMLRIKKALKTTRKDELLFGPIWDAWTRATPLFDYVTKHGSHRFNDGDKKCGCLTQIRNGTSQAYCPILTKAIAADERIPKTEPYITPEHLPLFAEWQRAIDKFRKTGKLTVPA